MCETITNIAHPATISETPSKGKSHHIDIPAFKEVVAELTNLNANGWNNQNIPAMVLNLWHRVPNPITHAKKVMAWVKYSKPAKVLGYFKKVWLTYWGADPPKAEEPKTKEKREEKRIYSSLLSSDSLGSSTSPSEAQLLWTGVRVKLQALLPRPTWETWFKDVVALGFDGEGRLVLKVGWVQAVEWIERRVYSILEREVGRPVKLVC